VSKELLFPNTLGICTSLPYGILKAENASMPTIKKLAKKAYQRWHPWPLGPKFAISKFTQR
jgi:hypothetical protein